MTVKESVAVVTGSNKGIGFAIVRGIAKAAPKWKVILTTRDVGNGDRALAKLKEDNIDNVEAWILDVANESSRKAFASKIKETFPHGVDVLVNNAGVFFGSAETASFGEEASRNMAVNFFGTLDFTELMIPSLKGQARIVTLGSMVGTSAYQSMSKENKAVIDNPNLTMDELRAFGMDYVKAAQKGTRATGDLGFPRSTYAFSKATVQKMSEIFDRDRERGMLFNTMHPGWVKSDMTGWDAPPNTAEEGADTAIYCALKQGPDVHGKYLANRKILPWRQRGS